VENGFLRCASIGIENVIYKDVAGVQTVTQCDLYEISIVDIPANQNAVKLYAQGRKPVHALSQTDNNNNNNKNQTFRGRIIDVLGLGDNATDEDIINEIKALKNSSTAIEKEVDDAVNNGLIARNEKDVFLSLAKGNRKAFRTYCSNRALIQESEIRTILKENSNKVITQEQGVFERIGKTMGAEVLRQVFSVMSSPIKLTQI
jgi:ribosomal protein S20